MSKGFSVFGYLFLNVFFFGGLTFFHAPFLASIESDGWFSSGTVFCVLVCSAAALYFWASFSDPGFTHRVPIIAADVQRKSASAIELVSQPVSTLIQIEPNPVNVSLSGSADVAIPIAPTSRATPDIVSSNVPFSRSSTEDEKSSLLSTSASPNFCQICRIERPPRSKHCYDCNRCVLRFDHHCPFLGNCVGGRNHYKFWWFLGVQVAVLCWAAWQTLSVLGAVPTGNLLLHVLVVVFFTFEICTLVMVASLWVFHTWLALVNQTTNEFIKMDRQRFPLPGAGATPFPPTPQFRGKSNWYPHDEGCIRNVFIFCCAPIRKEWENM